MSGKRIQDPDAPREIDVAGGSAKYVCTEIEDSRGRWNDDYNVRDGYFVIHDGENHHVYRLIKEDKVWNNTIKNILSGPSPYGSIRGTGFNDEQEKYDGDE